MTPTRAATRAPGPVGLAMVAIFAALGLWLRPAPAAAQIGSDRYAAIVLDARNGNTLI